jgi:tetratricopeptide (TPR) repeat protein
VAGELTLDRLLGVILEADTPDVRQASVRRYGPEVLADSTLMPAVLARATELRRIGRSAEADRIEQWHAEFMRRATEHEVMQALFAARTDAELEEVLRAHREMVDEAMVMTVVNQAGSLLSGTFPQPPAIAMPVALHLLGVAVRTALFLGGGELLADCLVRRSEALNRDGDYAAALADLREAGRLFRDAGNALEAGRCLSLEGSTLLKLGRADEALAALRASIGPLAEADDHALLAPTYEEIAGILYERGDEAQAAESFALAAELRFAAGQDLPIQVLQGLVARQLAHDDMDAALRYAERLVEALSGSAADELVGEDLVDLVRQAAIYMVVRALPEAAYFEGAMYSQYVDESRQSAARRWLRVAEHLHRFAPTDEGGAILTVLAANTALLSGDLETARRRADNGRAWFEAHGRQEGAVAALTVLMGAAAGAGDLAGATAWAARVADSGGLDAQGRAGLLEMQAMYRLKAGDPRGALRCLHEALAMSQREEGRAARTNEASAYTGLAQVYADLGDPEAAVDANAEAGRIAAEIGHRRGQAAGLHGLGVVLGKSVKGEFGPLSQEQVARLLTRVPDAPVAAAGPVALELAAVRLLERAAAAYGEIHDEAGWAQALTDLSNVIPDDQPEWKIRVLTEVLERKRALGDRLGQAVALANLGVAYGLLGEREASVAAFTESLAISRPAGFAMSATKSDVELGRLSEEAGDVEEAESRYAEAVELIESVRPNVPRSDAYLVGFAREKGRAYTRLVDLLVARGADDEAFSMVQRAKSRALLDLVGTTPLAPTASREGYFAELLDQEAACLGRLRAGEADADVALDALYDEMGSYDPDYVALRRGLPATVAGMRNWLAAQQRPVLLVEYFLSKSHLTLFALRAEWPSVQTHVETCTPDLVWDGYTEFRRQVVQYRNAGGQGWTRLSRLLTNPLQGWLQKGDLVCLVPHGVLHALPIHALPVEADPLIVDHPVAYAPTAGLFPLAQNPGKGTGRLESCAAFGVVFADEAEAVARLFGAVPVEPVGLTPTRVAALCEGKDVCHFSCHGVFNPVDPLSSGLLLNETQATRPSEPAQLAATLTARDVMGIRFQSELLCLSACDTGLSEVSGGDELIGLMRAFLYAGAPSIVASLWAVDADTTRELMVAFYTALRAQGVGNADKAKALRAAQLEMLRRAGARASYRWAPFVLIGDWR